MDEKVNLKTVNIIAITNNASIEKHFLEIIQSNPKKMLDILYQINL
ncbi:hypothetical protein IGI86_003303 [Enterococcus sp. AZ188]